MHSSSQNQPQRLHSVPPLWQQELPVGLRRTACKISVGTPYWTVPAHIKPWLLLEIFCASKHFKCRVENSSPVSNVNNAPMGPHVPLIRSQLVTINAAVYFLMTIFRGVHPPRPMTQSPQTWEWLYLVKPTWLGPKPTWSRLEVDFLLKCDLRWL